MIHIKILSVFTQKHVTLCVLRLSMQGYMEACSIVFNGTDKPMEVYAELSPMIINGAYSQISMARILEKCAYDCSLQYASSCTN